MARDWRHWSQEDRAHARGVDRCHRARFAQAAIPTAEKGKLIVSNLTLDEAVQALIAADIKLSIDFDSSHEPCPLTAEDAVHLFGTPTSWKLWRQGITE